MNKEKTATLTEAQFYAAFVRADQQFSDPSSDDSESFYEVLEQEIFASKMEDDKDVLIAKLTEALDHTLVCRVCSEDSWKRCETGKESLILLNSLRK